MLSFLLDCGRSVFLDSLHYSRTYGGLLEGRPNARLNMMIISRAAEGTQSRAFVIPPVVDHSDPDHPCLPPIQMIAEVWCTEPINAGAMGSNATLVWFREAWDEESLTEVVFDGIRGVDWEAVATDFDW